MGLINVKDNLKDRNMSLLLIGVFLLSLFLKFYLKSNINYIFAHNFNFILLKSIRL
jgi:hypothetical protein